LQSGVNYIILHQNILINNINNDIFFMYFIFNLLLLNTLTTGGPDGSMS
jgi:hypothetical protein